MIVHGNIEHFASSHCKTTGRFLMLAYNAQMRFLTVLKNVRNHNSVSLLLHDFTDGFCEALFFI
jgi:hypothetical protein